MRDNLDKIYTKTVAVLGSRWVLAAVIALFVLQSLWIAFSFRYPMAYDETFHVPVIEIFSHELDPFITDQPRSYDTYGDLEYTNSTLYHYVLSWPYRIIELFTQYEPYKIVVLRVINIAIFAAGLYMFARLFRNIKIKQAYINAGLLTFTALPIVPFVAAHVSYDNPLFLLTAIYLIFAAKIIQSKKIVWTDCAWLVAIGCLAALVKVTFLPIFAASVLYLLILLFVRHGKKLFGRLWLAIKNTPHTSMVVTTTALVVTIGLFSVTYLKPLMMFGTPSPGCTVTMSEERCMTGRKGFLIKRSQDAQKTKDDRPAVSVGSFTNTWLDNMRNATVFTAANTFPDNRFVSVPPIPLMQTMIFFSTIIGIGILLYSWSSISKNSEWYYMSFIVCILFVSIYYTNMAGYYETHQFFANQPRYLLNVAPIVIVMIVVASAHALRRYRWVRLGVFVGTLVLLTQGGGVITHILQSEDSWYWQQPTVIEANHKAKAVLEPLVKEN